MNRQAFDIDYKSLRRIVLALLRMAGFAGEFGHETIRRSVHRAVSRLLRPAEAATRRLIFVLSRGITVTLPPSRTAAPKPDDRRPDETHAEPVPCPVDGDPVEDGPVRVKPFVLVEPLAKFPSDEPRAFPGIPPRRGDEEISGARLADRLDALCHALDDMQGQAERLARWRARRERARERGVHCATHPLRGGPPLDLRGQAARRLKKHELFEVLKSAHHQAWWAVNAPPDTS